MSRRRLLALSAVVAITGHEAVLRAGHDAIHGPGLAAARHPAAWSAGVALGLVVLLLTTGWIAWRILALRWRLASVPVLRAPTGTHLARAWAGLCLAAITVFLVQENLEHVLAHGHLPALDPLLSGQYATALPIFAGLSLLVATASLTLALRIADLRSAVAALARRARHRPIARIARHVPPMDRRLQVRMATSLMARRGPPTSVPA